MIKVLEVVGRMDRAGQETFLMNIFNSRDREKYDIWFSVNTEKIGDYETNIIDNGGHIFHNKYPACKKYLFKYIKELRKFLRENKFDVVHTHVYYFSAFILWAAYKEKVPVRIMHSHNTSDGYKSTLSRKIYRKFSLRAIKKYSTNMVACGIDAYKQFYNEEPTKEKILNNSVNLSLFDNKKNDLSLIRNSLGITDEIVFINVARFSDVKNHKKTISIFNECLKYNNDLKLLLVGDGELKKEIENDVNKLNISNKVLFLGIRNDVNKLLMISNIFLMPSKFEGLPVSLVEAQAAGVKCVISDTITDEVDMGMGCIKKLSIFDSDEIWKETIFNCLKENVPSFEEREKCFVKNGYTIEEVWKKLERLYEQK